MFCTTSFTLIWNASDLHYPNVSSKQSKVFNKNKHKNPLTEFDQNGYVRLWGKDVWNVSWCRALLSTGSFAQNHSTGFSIRWQKIRGPWLMKFHLLVHTCLKINSRQLWSYFFCRFWGNKKPKNKGPNYTLYQILLYP